MDDVKKPLPVKIVEVIAWTYVALSLVGGDIGETPHFRFAFQRRFHSLSPLIAIPPDFPLAFSRPLCDNLSVPRN